MSDLEKRIEAPRIDWLDKQQVICDPDAIAEIIRRHRGCPDEVGDVSDVSAD